jgi:hypothetical protein
MHFQTKLAIDTNLMASNTDHNVSNTHRIVSDTQNIVSDTRKIVSDIHRVMVEHQGSDGANLPVSKHHTLFVTDNR